MADLYIRSSDGCTLTKVRTLNIERSESYYVIYGDLDYSLPLGAYRTEERAKEVLNEIQDFITPKVFVPQEHKFMSLSGFKAVCKDWKWEDFKQIDNIGVYTMPKE